MNSPWLKSRKQNEFLEIIIDNNETWKWHIDYNSGRLLRGIGGLLYIIRGQSVRN